MKKTILDTSFILSAVRNKIDFFEEIKLRGIQILVPDKVLKELKGLKAELALAILKKHKFKKIILKGKNTDKAIINHAKKNPEVIIATLDREIKKKTKNPKFVIRQKKKLEII